MVFVTRNPLWLLVGTLVSLAIAPCVQNAGADVDKIVACNK